MKAFNECDRRRDDKCIQFHNKCKPGQRIGVSKCWRMCEENEKYLQCPKCKSGLWFDNHVANSLGFGNTFFCPKCNKDVNRFDAIQTIKRLGEILRKNKENLSEWEKASEKSFLLPREYDELNYARHKDKCMKEMIISLVENSLPDNSAILDKKEVHALKVAEEFSESVKRYLSATNKTFRLPQGESIDLRPYTEKISEQYRKAPTLVRGSLLYFILKTMIKKFGDGRLNNWRRELALKLTEELEKI